MFTDPQKNIEALGLAPGMHVADLGAGSGFYVLEAAKRVGDSGRVYAVDVQKDLLQKIKNRAGLEHLFNIEVIWGNVEKIGGTKLKEGSMDLVIASNILFQVEAKNDFIGEAKRILKPKGRVFLIDWSDSFGGMGPAKEAVVLPKDARRLFEAGGFVFEREIKAGDHHYGLVFKKI
ncbi:MAG: hypothetical protein A2836_03590 [Candidatus Taylorbacteria bacterium RIFCSPHIGHO2_01_FULL_45_63]|uniref:Arsenite methyltransferase n=1 Tax=Candidatus Taylorbacteria bacterium RIFCSPHIGHO2_02_FULL_45_35 TaxID=1802311 RepID=A0A1G2MQB5_9BACT|nr:MAG: hypothetical protein A2836_03590 [Candidatus Taylorbacteria bacterium RIFCSPHIGHO2_01_FULL_45_63]OHA26048.1 MAG: hypothetical protein A3D56_02930 [Candidatus Taylorbacteria bacterium RIFCSPHIGHO2_02_FULL_45_35]OHA32477.1 MAG: hypothetical protein A3A22_01595 [Candidatus Taylorbacteria bacterium RIFCSPLOWO2_01_FULL_45_34b]